MSPSVLFDPDTLMQATELQVIQDEYYRAMQEPPWDGEQASLLTHVRIKKLEAAPVYTGMQVTVDW